jgi:hypothetical protein
MSANRANIGWHLANMIGADPGAATPLIIFKSEDGILDCYGITVPTDGTTDPAYAPGCTFRHVDGEVVATGTVDSADATSLIDLTLATTFDSDDELIGCYVVDTQKRIYGLIDDYNGTTGDITVDDWLDYDDAAVAATVFPAAGDAFIVFKKTSGNTLYVNTGNDIVGCRFERVLTAGMNESPLIDTQDGPSQAIWGGVDLNALRNMSGGFLYEDDFMGGIDVTNDDAWAIDTTTSGAIAPDTTDEGGVIVFDSAGNATADDGINAQLTNCGVLPAAGKTIYFEARVKMVDTGDDQYYIGLCEVQTAIIASGVVEDTDDKCGWFRDSGASPADDKLSTIISRAAAENEGADKASVADDTWVKLGFVINGLTDVKFYVNGELVQTNTTTASIPNKFMCLSFVSQVEQTSADAELRVDWVRLAQVGTRNA